MLNIMRTHLPAPDLVPAKEKREFAAGTVAGGGKDGVSATAADRETDRQKPGDRRKKSWKSPQGSRAIVSEAREERRRLLEEAGAECKEIKEMPAAPPMRKD